MANVLFLSSDKLKSMVAISNNELDKYLLSSIREAQDIGFQSVVGSTLYNYLKDLIASKDIDKVENMLFKELLDNAQYYIAYLALTNVVMVSNFKLDNVGVYQTEDEKLKPISLNDTFKLKDYYTNKADFYCKRLQEFILRNKTFFRDYMTCECIANMEGNLYSSASCSVFLGGARGKETSYKPLKRS